MATITAAPHRILHPMVRAALLNRHQYLEVAADREATGQALLVPLNAYFTC